MPRMDGTGPFGDGRPGRGLGPCGRRDYSRRLRGTSGFRRGVSNAAQPTTNTEFYSYDTKTLEAQKAELEEQLQWINDQLTNLKEDN